MGIQLPPELADVAAQTGVKWPEADEDKLRQSAQAWRDAGTKLSTLTTDADHTARPALGAVHGHTGDAARRHWAAFVHPDHGHLTRAARGCHAAADRLDHAATQVGAAKVEIVRNLTTLAKNKDAANTAAAAGHPHALLGLDTATQATTANLHHITRTLEHAVQPTSGTDIATTPNLLNPNPGHHPAHPGLLDATGLTTTPGAPHHGNLLNAVTDTSAGSGHHSLLGPVTDTTGLTSGPGTQGQHHGGLLSAVTDTTGVTTRPGAHGQHHGDLLSPVTDSAGLTSGPGAHGEHHGGLLNAVTDSAGLTSGPGAHSSGHGGLLNTVTDATGLTTSPGGHGSGHHPGPLGDVTGTAGEPSGSSHHGLLSPRTDATGLTGSGGQGSGHHGGLLGAVTDTTDGLLSGSGDHGSGSHPGLVNTVTDATGLTGSGGQGSGHHGGLLGAVTDTTDGLLGGSGDHGSGSHPGLVNTVTDATGLTSSGSGHHEGALGAVSDISQGVGGHPGDGPPGLGHPDVTGPVRIDPGPAHLDLPTPPAGVPLGQTVQAGLAPGAVVGSAGQVPAPAAPLLPVSDAPAPAAPVGGGPGAGFNAAPTFGPAPTGGPIPSGGPAPVAGGPVPSAPPPGAAPLAGPAAPAADQPRVAERGRGAYTLAVPPGQPSQPGQSGQPQQPAGAQAGPNSQQDGPEVLFWMYMFPIGHMPVVSDRPARQLPPPPEEVDYAPGMRFEPDDHPEHHRIESAWRLDELRAGVPALTPGNGLSAGHPDVRALAEGYDPLGGQHERDWDRRYLVRLGSVTADGISNEGKEYAWPPCEVYPEGGTAPGEPEMLAEGTVIDRFGAPDGRVFSTGETRFARRSLPPELLHAGYHRYRVTRPLPVWRTISAPWFGQPGGGERYRTTYSAIELLALGYLADITGGTA